MNSSCLQVHEYALEGFGKLPRTPCLQNASYLSRATLSVVGDCLFRQPVKPTGSSILFDLAIETGGFEFLEPAAKPGKVVRRKLRYSLFISSIIIQ
jgi:hypothetical protein